MKLKDYLEISQGCYCLILNNIGFKSRVFEKGYFNKKSKILNCNISCFYSTKIEDKIVQCIFIECKNLNNIKDFFSKEH